MRNIKIPGIYKHFKGALYATSFISEPITEEEFNKKVKDNGGWFGGNLITTMFTEDEYYIRIIREKNKYYHSNFDTEEFNIKMVGYVGITNPKSHVWLRPLEMFMSPVDKEKYPTVTQEFRFELVEGVWRKC